MSVGGAAISVALLRVALVVLATLWVPVERTFAEPVSYPDLAYPLPGAKNQTYADLVRIIAPGNNAGSVAASKAGVIPIRHIGGEDMTGVEPVSVESPRITAIPVRSGDQDRTALLLDFGETEYDVSGFVVLALFDVADEPRLLDAAYVAFDRYTSFSEPARLPVGSGDDLLMTLSTHHNSNQAYATTTLILAHNDRFDLIDTIQTFDDRACAYERKQRLDIRQGAEEPFSDIVAVVTELTLASGLDCGEETGAEPGTRTITVTYHWDSAEHRYIPDSHAFVVLAHENEQRF